MLIIQLEAGMATVSLDVGQIRRQILAVFPGAEVLNRPDPRGTYIEVDNFALMRSHASQAWAVCRIIRIPAQKSAYGTLPERVEHRTLIEGPEEKAIEWLIERVALGRLEKARREMRKAAPV